MVNHLEAAFLADHKILIRGLSDLQSAAESEDLDTAAKLAAALDEAAGPHIEFEESVFYPTLVDMLGEDSVAQLFAEHDSGRRAIETLRDAGASRVDWLDIRDALDTMMQHVLSCGSLLSYLAALDDERRDRLHEQLVAARRRGTKWTEIDRSRRIALPQPSKG